MRDIVELQAMLVALGLKRLTHCQFWNNLSSTRNMMHATLTVRDEYVVRS